MKVNHKCIDCAKNENVTARSMDCYKGRSCLKKRSYYRKHDTYKKKMRIALYNITEKEYDTMLIKQNNACAICKEVFKTTPSIDHNHLTSKVRGLLCTNCNHLLGSALDNKQILMNAIVYLTK